MAVRFPALSGIGRAQFQQSRLPVLHGLYHPGTSTSTTLTVPIRLDVATASSCLDYAHLPPHLDQLTRRHELRGRRYRSVIEGPDRGRAYEDESDGGQR